MEKIQNFINIVSINKSYEVKEIFLGLELMDLLTLNKWIQVTMSFPLAATRYSKSGRMLKKMCTPCKFYTIIY